ncbi:MAG: hypothetical protein HY863_19085 [Chloroflexi bacterium]|nr:hypothetical protein [Chloroflexota bacterium]
MINRQVFSMMMKKFTQSIQNLFKPQEPLTDDVILKFLKVMESARAEEMTCSELFTQLDEFVEREVNSKDAEKIMPLVQEHLDMCSDCCDEYEALLSVLENTRE